MEASAKAGSVKVNDLAEKQKERLKERKEKEEKQMATRRPIPKGFKLLIALPEVDEKTDGGIIKSAETQHVEEIGSIVGYVVAMGPDAYKDPKRCSEPYCKVGDWVLMRSYSGTRFQVDGKEMRLINDDSVEAVVEDPRGISKV